MLLIQDMPLERFTLQNLARLELVISWASALAALRHDFARHAEKEAHVSHRDFITPCSQKPSTDQAHGIPSVMLRMRDRRRPQVRSLDANRCRCHPPRSPPRSPGECDGNLLPFSGEAEAAGSARAVEQSIPGARTRHHIVSGGWIILKTFWQLLQQASRAAMLTTLDWHHCPLAGSVLRAVADR